MTSKLNIALDLTSPDVPFFSRKPRENHCKLSKKIILEDSWYLLLLHSVQKWQKKSHSKSEGSYIYILSGQSSLKSQNWLILAGFENLKYAVKQCYQTGQFLIGQRLKENANIEKIKWDIFKPFSVNATSKLHEVTEAVGGNSTFGLKIHRTKYNFSQQPQNTCPPCTSRLQEHYQST